MEFARKFSFHRIFTSHMVLQRERPIRLSGKAEPGRFVTLSFAGRERCVAAEADGENLSFRVRIQLHIIVLFRFTENPQIFLHRQEGAFRSVDPGRRRAVL